MAGIVLLTMTPATAIIPPDTRCARGAVALTFDDGPSATHTPKLLRILRKHDAQATFFVQGQYAEAHPSILRQMVRDGHAVENHSWDHPALTTRPNRSVKRQLRLTQTAIRNAIGQKPTLFRPPYGDTSKRVRKIADRYDLKQELWTTDTSDWAGGGAASIRKAALRGLRPHRSNVILMHDNVGNSGATLKAVPSIIQRLRAKGYCLVPLEPMAPLGRVSAKPVEVDEGAEGSSVVGVKLVLDGPAQRKGSFRIRSIAGTAKAGEHFRSVRQRIHLRRGQRAVVVELRVMADSKPNRPRTLTLQLDKPRDLRLSTTKVPVTITDNQVWNESVEQLISSSRWHATTLAP